ncbi:MAG: hypothetical protein M1828_000258 [Chrysothrix sp. TS-e1954]|nr:MAG: hypothetical protein M1828_000258 [Chrysothrix sp. TS-e1954]
MFRNKRRSTSNPQPNPTPSAASAAAQAFIKKQANDGVLSSSAAAAALRSHTTTPTPISELQTKRMVRRGSASSHGSPAGSFRQPFSSGLQRQNSNGSMGSMSQRSLRSPSPSRRLAPTPYNDVPPVPKAPTIPPKSVRRSASLEPPRRVMSPVQDPNQMSRTGGGDAASTAPPKKRAAPPSNLERVPEKAVAPVANQGSPRQNINFSRPMSPPLSPRSTQSNAPNSPTGGARAAPRPRPASSLGFHHDNVASLPVQTQINIARAQQRAAPALVAAASAARPTSTAPSQGPLRKPSSRPQAARPASMAVPTEIAEVEEKKPDSGVDMNTRKIVKPIYPPVKPKPTADERAAAALAVPSPSDEQIKKFQTRAVSMLARPLYDERHAAAARESSASPAPARTADDSHLNVSKSASPNSTPQRSATTSTNRFSVSPARSAHFSDSPLLEVTKHTPPARSISPVKSAMKGSSPGPSPDTSRVRDDSVTSEARSQMSEDSNAPAGKKKKSVRVSFEERPILVGQAAPSMMSPTDTVMSPQYRKGPGSDDDDESRMGARPALPSFGSVRSRKSDPEESASSTQPSAQTDNANTSGPDVSPDLTAPSIAVQPATPRAEDNETMQLESPREQTEPIHKSEQVNAQETQSASTHVSPATLAMVAGIQDDTERDAESDENSEVFSDAAEEQDEDDEVDEERDDGGYGSLDAIVESPSAGASRNDPMTEQKISAVANTAPQLSPIPTTAEPEAAEGGDWDMVTAYWKGLSEQKKLQIEQEAQAQPEEPEGEEAKQPESNTAQSEPVNGKVPLPPWPDKQYQASVKPPKSALKKTTPVQRQPEQASDTISMRKSMRNTKSTSSLSEPVTDPTHMRKSMRNSSNMSSPARGTREELSPPRTQSAPRQSAPRQQATPQAKSSTAKPSTQTVPGASPAAVALAKGVAAAHPQAFTTAPKATPKKPGLGRTLSNDSSASDSSFQRNRRKKNKSDGGRYTMARSMRGGPAGPDSRAMSPPPPPPTQEAPKRTAMRTSVRGSTDTARSTMRSPEPSKSNKSSSILGFGKSKQKAPKKGGAKPTSRFGSRFSDSSDEEGEVQTFRSRFDDSDDSDDDAPAAPKLTPVRGIPKKAGQQSGDSTELSDEEPEPEPVSKPRPSTPPAQIALEQHVDEPAVTNGAAVGNALNAGTLRKDTNKEETADKPSRFSMFGHAKKRSEQVAPEQVPSPEKTSMSPSDSPSMPKTMRPSRKDYQSPSRATKMFRRLSSSRNSSPNREAGKEDFPFPPPPIPDEYKDPATTNAAGRPNTSDGVAKPNFATARPGLGEKRDSTMTAPESMTSAGRPKREPVVSGRTGKKKKFQGLRRAFGLND